MKSKVYENLREDQVKLIQQKAHDLLGSLVQEDQYVGELYSIGYEHGLVQIHDRHRMEVGGIPGLSFLIATRIKPGESIDYTKEDSSIILLRVMDAAPLPNASEIERIRVQAAQRAAGENSHWDEAGLMDGQTANLLSFAGVKCRVIGTFYLDLIKTNEVTDLTIRFGGDLSNYYPNRGLKVYKPNGEVLERIVNYFNPENIKDHIEKYGNSSRVQLGQIRYASTNRKDQSSDNVPVYIHPADLLSQKSALFGMTRTGKSNTTKIIAKSVFQLRNPSRREDRALRIGQIIFDPNGEYANENDQDMKDALKNIWKTLQKTTKENEVVTYGLTQHPNDPDRKLLKINFYHEDMLQTGKEIIDIGLSNEQAQYFRNFIQVRFEKPEKTDYENESEFFAELIRFKRRVLVYRAILKKAGFPIQRGLMPVMVSGKTPLFSNTITQSMASVNLPRNEIKKQNLIRSGAAALAASNPSWEALVSAFEGLFYYLSTNEYNTFNDNYIRSSSSGESWADPDLEKLLEMFSFSKGTNLIGKSIPQHSETANTDFAEDIFSDLVKGKLVILDQSTGEPDLNKEAAERIMWKIFRRNQASFRDGKTPVDILVYIEEAHNLLPSGSETNLEDVWVRTAKEGAKYHIGMVYATQEVSSIQKNILRNSANWFISHLNNTDETKELCKYYDFCDFEPSIRRVQDKGFLRIKTLSNPFVIPAQIDLFEVK